MWARAWLLLLLPAIGVADSRIVTRVNANGYVGLQTEYHQGRNMRWENAGYATVINADQGQIYQVELRKNQWSRIGLTRDPLLRLAMWIQRPPRVRESGKTVNVWYETRYTGERRDMFGHLAMHIVSRERRVAEPGACEKSSERVTDGWYLPEASARQDLYYLTGPGTCRDNIVEHGRPPRPRIAMLETMKSARFTMTREVVQYSEKPLDRALFSPPGGPEAVPRRETWTERAESDLQQVQRAVRSWFQ